MPPESFVAVQPTFDQIEQELGAGMVPRIFRLLESQPDLLNHLWGQFRTVVLQGHLPRVLKEMVGLVVANATHCEYVRVVHLHSLTLQGVDQQALQAVSQGNYEAYGISRMARGALNFASTAVATRAAYANPTEGNSGPSWEQLRTSTAQALASIGLEAEEQLELVATVALFEQICTVANLLSLDPSQP
ncbi:carboxymuconolactone decarboxylase family protein [Leptolyngbya sp. FACHB-261]|uniref:carboxymuconolactone decarboxylase family protein n=1 Tax=Leptolyngbya sp. FACHB-261 TaxID=2692806 RepID=UPI001687D1B2|nr:carboxymuconolactone decarboxylase family protein [Leptolyngbya sp. FACHB-261]MBD2099414.1 carboxymuconolactone decarboxylase family protein [Leptolyngbya sp. FACHB-261]